MDYTTAINYVLRRMRESQVSDPSSSEYALTIGDMINETKREVEAAHKWAVQRTEFTIPMVQDTFTYTVSGLGDRSQLEYLWHNEMVQELGKSKANFMDSLLKSDTTVQGTVAAFYLTQGASEADGGIVVYPRPDATTQNLTLVAYVPQADFSTGSEVFDVPSWPVRLGAYARALDERGENSGAQVSKAEQAYQLAVADAITQDIQRNVGDDTWSLDNA